MRILLTFSGTIRSYDRSLTWTQKHCSFIVFMMPLYALYRFILFPLKFNNFTGGGQSVSFVRLWQPSDCTDSFVIVYICVLFSENRPGVMMM